MANDGGFVISGKDNINVFRLLSIRGRLSLELLGMKSSSGRSTFAIVKREFGFKGNNENVYKQYIAMLVERGIIEDYFPCKSCGHPKAAHHRINNSVVEFCTAFNKAGCGCGEWKPKEKK